MVPVAQLAERQIVALEVAGSSPVGHPNAHPMPWMLVDGIRGIAIGNPRLSGALVARNPSP